MTRYLGLDLGTKTLGVAITDKANIMVHPYTIIRFNKEDYKSAISSLKEIIEKEKITDVAIGLPKNMDGSLGFAADRTKNFIPLIESLGVKVTAVDERLTSVEAHRILHESDIKEKNFKDKVDSLAAVLILESFMGSIKWVRLF